MTQADYRRLYRAKLAECKELEAENAELAVELVLANDAIEKMQAFEHKSDPEPKPRLLRLMWEKVRGLWRA